jgi:DNA-binding NarL/FixJ family response regulator
MHNNAQVIAVAWPTLQDVTQDAILRDRIARPKSLTPRQMEVAQLVAAGRDDHEIADELSLAPGTISHYVRQICVRRRLFGRSEIAAWLAAEAAEEHPTQ